MSFIILWLLGDVTSLAGAVLAHLVPTVIILSVYVSGFIINRTLEGGAVSA